jgi:hypothetical protein
MARSFHQKRPLRLFLLPLPLLELDQLQMQRKLRFWLREFARGRGDEPFHCPWHAQDERLHDQSDVIGRGAAIIGNVDRNATAQTLTSCAAGWPIVAAAGSVEASVMQISRSMLSIISVLTDDWLSVCRYQEQRRTGRLHRRSGPQRHLHLLESAGIVGQGNHFRPSNQGNGLLSDGHFAANGSPVAHLGPLSNFT